MPSLAMRRGADRGYVSLAASPRQPVPGPAGPDRSGQLLATEKKGEKREETRLPAEQLELTNERLHQRQAQPSRNDVT